MVDGLSIQRKTERYVYGTWIPTVVAKASMDMAKVYALAISKDNRLLATALWTERSKVWSLDSGDFKRTLRGHKSDVQTVQFGPDDRQLISGSMDYQIKVWNLETGEEIASRQAHKLPVHTVAVHPSKPLLASSGWDGLVHLWALDGPFEDSKSVKATSSGSRMIGLDFSPDGELLALASSDGRAYLWSMGDEPPQSLSGHRGELNLIRFHPTGQSVITSSDDKTMRMWNIQQRALRWFGLVIVLGDGWVLTHRGWSNVNRSHTSDNPSKQDGARRFKTRNTLMFPKKQRALSIQKDA